MITSTTCRKPLSREYKLKHKYLAWEKHIYSHHPVGCCPQISESRWKIFAESQGAKIPKVFLSLKELVPRLWGQEILERHWKSIPKGIALVRKGSVSVCWVASGLARISVALTQFCHLSKRWCLIFLRSEFSNTITQSKMKTELSNKRA